MSAEKQKAEADDEFHGRRTETAGQFAIVCGNLRFI
jgi:hypothetical protein